MRRERVRWRNVRGVCTPRTENVSEKCACDTECVCKCRKHSADSWQCPQLHVIVQILQSHVRQSVRKFLDMSRVPCIMRDVFNGAPQLKTTLSSSYPTPLVMTLAQRNQDQTRISACSQIFQTGPLWEWLRFVNLMFFM